MATQEGLLGIRERYIAKEESVYGTAPSLTTAFVFGFDNRITPRFEQGFQEVLSAGTDNRNVEKRVSGPLILPYDHEFFPANWRFLKFMFDIDSETGSNPYVHTLSVGNTLKSYTSEWAMRHSSDPIIYKLVGNVMKKLEISFTKPTGEGKEGQINCKCDVVAQDYTNPSLQAGSFTATGTPFQYRHNKITLASGEVVEINSGTITFEQGIQDNDSRYANSSLNRKMGAPIATVFRIFGTININLVDATTNDIWALADELSGTNTIEFIKDANDKIVFTLSGVYVNPVPIAGTNIDGVNTGDFVFTATGVVPVATDAIENW